MSWCLQALPDLPWKPCACHPFTLWPGLLVPCFRWCGSQLLAIAGSDDLTLAKFCMTLDSASDVTEYMVQYLVSVCVCGVCACVWGVGGRESGVGNVLFLFV